MTMRTRSGNRQEHRNSSPCALYRAVNDLPVEPSADRPEDENRVSVADRLAERLPDGSF